MAAELARRGLRDHRRALVGWCLGVAAYVGMIAAIFPSIEGSPEPRRAHRELPGRPQVPLRPRERGEHHVRRRLPRRRALQPHAPLLVLVLAIGSGARAIAGEEDAGRLELVLSYPLRRRDAVLAKGAAVGLEVLVVCVVAGSAVRARPARRARPLDGACSRLASLAASASSTAGSRSAVGARPCRAARSRSACRRASRRAPTSSTASTSSPAGSTRSASSRRSGSSAPRRSEEA